MDKLEAAQSLKTSLDKLPLRIVNARSRFDTKQSSDERYFQGEGSAPTDPALVSVDVTSQLAFLRKLKFQYLEQKAKDQYIKTIVSDDAPAISAGDNEELRVINEQKKATLKLAKQRLAEKHQDIQTLAPLVEQDYYKARLLSDEAVVLARKILDTRLDLTRLRQTFPQPRLTIHSANDKLDAQVKDMQALGDELEALNEKLERVKEKVREGAKDLERLRIERAEKEKLVKMERTEVEDERVLGLYDWYTASLQIHQALLGRTSRQMMSQD